MWFLRKNKWTDRAAFHHAPTLPLRALADAIDAHLKSAVTELSEDRFRQLILDELLNPRLELLDGAMQVLASRLHYRPSQSSMEDARDAMEDRLRVAVTGDGTTEPVYDVERALHVSTVGWARQYLRGVARRTRVKQAPESLDTIIGHESMHPTVTELARISDQQLDILQEAERSMGGRRMPQRLFLGKSFIQRAFDIPALQAPTTREQRDDTIGILKALGADAAEELRAASHDDQHTLSALFTGWSDEDRQRFTDRGDELVITYLIASLSPRPKPPEHVVAHIKRTVRAASGRTGWSTISVHLVRSWLAEYFSALTDYDGRSDSDQAELRRSEEAKLWPPAVQRVLEFPGRPLPGSGPEDIDRLLSEILAEVGTDNRQ